MADGTLNPSDRGVVDRPKPIVYVVEDQAGARDDLLSLIAQRDYRCQAFATAEEFLAAGPPNRPACLVLDYRLPGVAGLELQDRLLATPDALPIIVTTGHADVPAAVRFMERGDVTLLEKPFLAEQLLDAVDRAIAHDTVSRRVRHRFESISRSVNLLSQRERTVLQAIVSGQLNKSIARTLDVSVRTIEGDRAKIVDKFGAETTGEVVGKFAQYSLMTELGYRSDPTHGEGAPAPSTDPRGLAEGAK